MSDVRHTFNNPQPDGSDNTVQRPSDWNAQHLIPAGSAAAPSVGPSADSSTGWFFPDVEVAALSTNGVERLRVESDGIITVNLEAGAIYDSLTWGQTLNGRFNSNTTFGGTGTAGSGNEFGLNIQMLVPGDTSATAGYEKAALYVLATTADPSASAVLNRDIVGIDTRGYIAVAPGQLGRAWGLVALVNIPAGGYDGQIIAIEVDVYNSGTDQASTMTTTSKYGIHGGNFGSTPATAWMHVINSGSTFHYGFVMHTDALALNTDRFLWLTDTASSGDSSTGIFEVDKLGNVSTKAGTTGMTSGFVYLPAAAGVATGVPTSKTGRVAAYFDTTNNKIGIYDGGWLWTAALT